MFSINFIMDLIILIAPSVVVPVLFLLLKSQRRTKLLHQNDAL